MSGRLLAGLSAAIVLLGLAARILLWDAVDPPAFEPPPPVAVPEDAIRFTVHASGAVEADGSPIDESGVLDRLRTHADRSRDAEGISREAMAVVADPEAAWCAVREVLSLCGHPDVRMERVYLVARGVTSIRLAVPRGRLPPRSAMMSLAEDPQIDVRLMRRPDGLEVVLLDSSLGVGDRAFENCDRRIQGILELSPGLPARIGAGGAVTLREVLRLLQGILGLSPELPARIGAGGGVTLREVLRLHALVAAHVDEIRFHRAPNVWWQLEAFYRKLDPDPGKVVFHVLADSLEHDLFFRANEAACRLADLWELDRHREKLLAGLRDALRSDDERLQDETLRALEIFVEPEALGPLVPDLLAIRRDDEFLTHTRLDLLLEKIGAPVAEHFARIAREEPEPSRRLAAIHWLEGLAREHVVARAALRNAMADRDAEVRTAAAKRLVELGMETTSALEVLQRGVRAGERPAVLAVMGLREKAEPAIPDLLAGLSDLDVQFRRWVAFALGRIALEDPEVRAILERIATDEDEDTNVRLAARSLIKD